MTHSILITTDAEVRQRWEKAFPGAPVYFSPAAVSGRIAPDAVVWLHVGADHDIARSLVAETLATLGPCPLVALSDIPSDNQALELMEQGVVGYCHAYAGPAMLQQVSTVVANKGLWVGPDLMQRMIRAAGANVAVDLSTSKTLETLSGRELEVARKVGTGSSNKEIARALDITERTVKAHLSAIFSKLGVRDRLHLALFMRSAGAV